MVAAGLNVVATSVWGESFLPCTTGWTPWAPMQCAPQAQHLRPWCVQALLAIHRHLSGRVPLPRETERRRQRGLSRRSVRSGGARGELAPRNGAGAVTNSVPAKQQHAPGQIGKRKSGCPKMLAPARAAYYKQQVDEIEKGLGAKWYRRLECRSRRMRGRYGAQEHERLRSPTEHARRQEIRKKRIRFLVFP